MEILHPVIAGIKCSDCRVFVYNLKTGEPEYYPPGSGKLVERGANGPPCMASDKVCPKVKPDYSDLTPQNRMVWEHWKRCRAVGVFPDDDTVREHAVLIGAICENIERKRNAAAIANELAVLIRGSMR